MLGQKLNCLLFCDKNFFSKKGTFEHAYKLIIYFIYVIQVTVRCRNPVIQHVAKISFNHALGYAWPVSKRKSLLSLLSNLTFQLLSNLCYFLLNNRAMSSISCSTVTYRKTPFLQLYNCQWRSVLLRFYFCSHLRCIVIYLWLSISLHIRPQ